MKRAASASYLLKILVPARPGIRRIENLRRYAFAFDRHIEAKDRIFLVLHLEQGPLSAALSSARV